MSRVSRICALLMFAVAVIAPLVIAAPSTAPTTRRIPATTRRMPATTAATTRPQIVLPDPSKAPPAPFDLTDSATQAESVSTLLRSMESDVRSDRSIMVIQSELPVLTTEINARLDETSQLLEASPSLQLLENQEQDWKAIDEELVNWADGLNRDIDRLKGQVDQIKALVKSWQQAKARAEYFLPNPRARDLIESALASIDPTIQKITDTRSDLGDRLHEVVKLKQGVNAQDAQVHEVLESVRESRAGAFNRLFTRNEPPVWSLFGKNAADQSVVQDGQNSFRRQLLSVWAYIHRRYENVGGQILLLVALLVGIYFVRGKVLQWAEEDPGFNRATLVFASPVSTALVLSLLFSVWIYPQAPRLFWAMVGAAALIPTVLILRKLIDRRLFPILDALVVFYFMDQIRAISAAVPFVSRMLFLIQMLGATLLLASFIHSVRAQPSRDRLWQLVLVVSWLELTTFALALLGNAIGYVSLASLLGDAALKSAYLAVILYAGISIAIGLLVIALRTRPLSMLGMVRRHQPLLLRRLTVALQWIASSAWLLGLLAALAVTSTLFEWTGRLLNVHASIAGNDVSLGNVLLFVFDVWAAFIVSRFLRFLLEEDVYDRFALPGGMSYAISKMLNYVVLLIGFFVAIHALGFEMSKFTILAGAFGVGLGFGMQNIVNNFVSGLILLFERPVKVGDVIQMNDVTGVVGHIGIRASILRTADSSEIIIPNGNLISSQVTNWTLSNRQRGILIALAVASSADPNRVIQLLIGTAAAHPQIVTSPAPQAFLTKFAADSFSYELHVWTNEAERWIQIRSDLAVALNAALVKENIPIR